MKVPLLATVRDLAGPSPAVAAVAVGGFLSLSCAVIRLGDKRAWETFVLVPVEHRSMLWSWRRKTDPDWNGWDFQSGPFGRASTRETSGEPGTARTWINASNAWVRAAFLVHEVAQVPDDTRPWGLALLGQVAQAALDLTGEATRSATEANP